MAFSKTNVVVVLLLALAVANKVVSQGDSTSFTFDSFSESIDTLIYQGDAFVPSSSSFVRLTAVNSSDLPAYNSIGRLVYAPVVNFWAEGQQATFETTIKFVVSPVDTRPGDGITFFIAPVNSTIPPGSNRGNMGLFDPNTGLAPYSVFAVEFDPASNPWDPSYQHIGIDINSRESRNVSAFQFAVGEEVTARINYVSNTRTITVVASYGSVSSSLSYVFDLKTVLPRQVQVGISGNTGSWVAFHDLHAWYFSSSLVWDGSSAPPVDETHIRQYVD